LLGFGDQSLPKLVRELKQLTVDYAKQETLDPLKGLLRYAAYGLLGALLLGIGLTIWVVAMLRVLQEETGSAFTGHLSWAPYALTLVATVVIAALSTWAIFKEKRASRRRRDRRATAAAATASAATTPKSVVS
jgi:uncharacterized BrkB/YihY/UPF0761 family membrane protein